MESVSRNEFRSFLSSQQSNMVEVVEKKEFVCKEGPVIMPEQTLIGKLHITGKLKSIEPYHVIIDINRAWSKKTISKFTITELGYDMFGFHFKDERDMRGVMDSRPWLVSEYHDDDFDPYLVLLTEWRPNTPPSEIEFSDSYPFWIQVHNIAFEYMSREMGKKVCERTGHAVLDVVFDGTINSRKMKYLRVRVLVNVNKKIATGCWLLTNKNQPKKVLWVQFKYEEFPMFCFKCGIIGHSEDSCRCVVEEDDAFSYNPEGDENELPEVLVEGQLLRVEGEKGYGHWLYERSANYEEDEEVDDEDED